MKLSQTRTHSTGFAGEAVVPAVYNNALSAVDPSGVGEISVSALSRVVGTSGLPAAIVDRVRFSFPTLLLNIDD
jgi:hypothetical protein